MPVAAKKPLYQVERRTYPRGKKGSIMSIYEVADRATKYRNDPETRAWALRKLMEAKRRGVDLSEPKAQVQVLLDAVQKDFLYANDPPDSEMIVHPRHLVSGWMPGGDCFAEGTLLLAEGHRLVPIEKIEVGMRIWGLDRWVRVLAAWEKGPKSIDIVQLNNGSQLRLTSNHLVNVLECPRHSLPDPEETSRRPCSCPAHERVVKTMHVADLKPGMVLPSPERLPFGTDTSLSPERAYVEGLYVSDGWSEDYRFAISGQDGCPKEAQKREVKEICDRLGVATSWQPKYLRVNDPVWTKRMQQMGEHAPDKHLLSINLGEAQVIETVRGVMADSGANTHGTSRTLTTTSRLLAVQMRLLHKMLGVSCGWSYIESHGGFGKNPIWRLTTRNPERKDGKPTKLLRVRSVERDVAVVPCYDITTEDSNVYLAEHDVTVHNCDDKTLLLLVALVVLAAAGYRCASVGHGYEKGSDNVTHVLGAVELPEWVGRKRVKKWFRLETTIEGMKVGEVAAKQEYEIAYGVPGAQLLCKGADSCLVGETAIESPTLPGDGDFVGVAGIGPFAVAEPSDNPLMVDGDISAVVLVDPALATGQVVTPGTVMDRHINDGTYQGTPPPGGLVLFGDPEGTPVVEAVTSDCRAPQLVPAPGHPWSPWTYARVPGQVATPWRKDRMPFLEERASRGEGGWTPFGRPGAPAQAPHPSHALEEARSGGWTPWSQARRFGVRAMEEATGTQVAEALWPAWKDYLNSVLERLRDGLGSVNLAYEQFRDTCNQQGIGFPPSLPDAPGLWTAEEQALLADATAFVQDAIRMLEQAVLEQRPVEWVQVGDRLEIALGTLAGDAVRYVASAAWDNMTTWRDYLPSRVPLTNEPGQVGVGIINLLLPAIAGGAVALTVGMALHGESLLRVIETFLYQANRWLMLREARKMQEAGASPEQVKGLIGQIDKGTVDTLQKRNEQLKAEKEKIEAERDKAVAWLDRAIAIGVIALIAAGGGFAIHLNNMKKAQQQAA